MVAEDKHWQYFLTDENGNSYAASETVAPSFLVTANTPTVYLQIEFDSNYITFRQTQIIVGPTVVAGDKYYVIINGVVCVYVVQSGDNTEAVRNGILSAINSTLHAIVVTCVSIGTNKLFIQTTPSATTLDIFIGNIIAGSSVSVLAGQLPLTFTPDGWQEISIAWERNLTKFGNVRNFSLPLKFVVDGAKIIRSIVYSTNFETKVFLLIKRLKIVTSPIDYNYFYEDYYRGEIDLSTFNDEESTVTVNIMEGDLHKKLKANEGTTYEIPCDEIFVRMDGLELFGNSRWLNIQESIYQPGPGSRRLLWPFITHINAEGATFDGEFYSTQPLIQQSVSSDTDDNYFLDNYFFRLSENATGSTSVKITGNLPYGLGAGTALTVYVKNSNGSRTIIASRIGVIASSVFYFNANVTVSPGEKLYLIIRLNGPLLSTALIGEGEINLQYTSRFRETNIIGVKPFTLFYRLIEQICGDAAYAQSDVLNDYENLIVTCGDSLRGFGSAVSRIKTSLNEFMDSFNAILNIGIGIINGKVVVERKEFFVENANIIALGATKDMKVQIAKDLLFNTIKIGYQSQTYDDINGRYEFNNTSVYTTDVKRVVKTLELVSKYRADPFGIEYARINMEGKTSTDSSDDNNVFIINVNLASENVDGSYNLKRVVYDSVIGIPYPASMFNIEELTPARMIKKHLGYINSCLSGFENTNLVYQSSDKNRNLKTVVGGVTVDEDANILLDGTGKIFKPFVFEFDNTVPIQLVEDLQNDPNRCFSFEHPNGETFKGFNLKIGIKPDTDEEQSFVLLSTPDNDILNLL